MRKYELYLKTIQWMNEWFLEKSPFDLISITTNKSQLKEQLTKNRKSALNKYFHSIKTFNDDLFMYDWTSKDVNIYGFSNIGLISMLYQHEYFFFVVKLSKCLKNAVENKISWLNPICMDLPKLISIQVYISLSLDKVAFTNVMNNYDVTIPEI